MAIEALNIKQAEIAEEIWFLQHLAYRVEADLIGVAELPPLLDTIESLQQCGESFIGFREADETLSGAVSFEQEPDNAYAICRLMVHPQHFRKGIGRLLVRHLFELTPRHAVWTVTAEIRNLPAIALYEKSGFVRRHTFQPAPGITMIRFERT